MFLKIDSQSAFVNVNENNKNVEAYNSSSGRKKAVKVQKREKNLANDEVIELDVFSSLSLRFVDSTKCGEFEVTGNIGSPTLLKSLLFVNAEKEVVTGDNNTNNKAVIYS